MLIHLELTFSFVSSSSTTMSNVTNVQPLFTNSNQNNKETKKRDRVVDAIDVAKKSMIEDHDKDGRSLAQKFLDGSISRNVLYAELHSMENEENDFETGVITWNDIKRFKTWKTPLS